MLYTKLSLTYVLSSFCLVAWRPLCPKQSKIRLKKNYGKPYYLLIMFLMALYGNDLSTSTVSLQLQATF